MRKKKETFMQSIVILMIAQVIVKILGLVYKLYLTNKSGFGDEGNAITSAAFQVYSLLLSITSIGVPGAVSKLVAERSAIGDNKGAYKIFKISLALFSVVGIIGSYILVYCSNMIANEILGIPEVELSLMALAPSIFLVSIISVYKGYFNGRQKMGVTANAGTCDQLTKTCVTILMIEIATIVSKVTNISEIVAVANLATTIGNTIEFTYLYIYYRKELGDIKHEILTSVNHRPVRTIKTIKEIICVAGPMSLAPFIGTIGKNFDSTTIIGGLQAKIGYEEAKIQYGILNGKVDTLINFPLSFCGTISTALIPGIAAAKSKNKLEEVQQRINLSLLVGLLIAFPITAVFFFYSDSILKLLFPNASAGSIILQISSLSIIFISIEQTIRGVLIGIGNNRIPIISITIGVIIKIILNKVLIPINSVFGGINGATISNLISHIIMTIICYTALKKEINVKIRKKNILKSILATLGFVLLSKTIYNMMIVKISTKISLIISLLLGIVIYGILIIVFKIFDLKQVKILSFSQKKEKNSQKEKKAKTLKV